MQLFNLNAKKLVLPALGVLLEISLNAQEKAPKTAESNSLFTNGVFIVMLCVVIFLMIAIVAMAEFVKGAAAHRLSRKKKGDSNEGSPAKTAEGNAPAEVSKAVVTLLFLLLCGPLFAQAAGAAPEAQPVEEPFTYWGMGAMTFYVMMVVMAFEVLIFAMLYRSGMSLRADENKKAAMPKRRIVDSAIVRAMTGTVPVEQEASLVLDHDYDGIRELDNNLPPWWKYGFYLTIVIAVIYMLNYHVFHTGKSSIEAYEREMIAGEQQVAEYKRTHAGLVDETNVKRLTDDASISAGADLFKANNCTACHGDFAEGKSAPNLTDDYWLHKGGTADIFKSIKYGWPDKGMIAWEKTISAVQIQQIVSWIQSRRGSNPPNAKEPQGEIYMEGGAAPADTTGQKPGDPGKSAVAPEK